MERLLIWDETQNAMNILCATDFSEPAHAAANVAGAIAARIGRSSTVHLLHCVPDWLIPAGMPGIDTLVQTTASELEAEMRRLHKMGVCATKDLGFGPAANQILAVAEAQSFDLLVLGASGAGTGRHWLIGGVAKRVVSHVPIPTLVVRNQSPLLSWQRDRRPLKVLCAVDMTSPSDAATAYVMQLLSWGIVQVEAAYISDVEDTHTANTRLKSGSAASVESSDLEQDLWERTREAIGGQPLNSFVVRTSSTPAAAFLQLAKDREADLLVVGAHQRHGLSRLTNPSFSEQVVVHSGTNVLCVPLRSYHADSGVASIRNVLVATDFSGAANNAIHHAIALLPFGGRIKLLHVYSSPSPSVLPDLATEKRTEMSSEAARDIAALEASLDLLVEQLPGNPSIHFSTEVATGHDVAHTVCQTADSFGADVICLGTHSRSRLATVLLGSTMQALLTKTRRTVCIIHPPRE